MLPTLNVCAGFSKQRQSGATRVLKPTKCVLSDQTLCILVFVIMTEVWFYVSSLDFGFDNEQKS